LYKHVTNRSDNLNIPAEHAEKEKAVSTAFFQYLVTTGIFKEFVANKDAFKSSLVCSSFLFQILGTNISSTQGGSSILIWEALRSMPGISELAGFMILLLLIVMNQAGCE
jgi:hypothetical protein